MDLEEQKKMKADDFMVFMWCLCAIIFFPFFLPVCIWFGIGFYWFMYHQLIAAGCVDPIAVILSIITIIVEVFSFYKIVTLLILLDTKK